MLRQLCVIALTVLSLVAGAGVSHAASIYSVFDETNVSPQERGTFRVNCETGRMISYRIMAKNIRLLPRPNRTGVSIDFVGRSSEQTLSVRLTCLAR